MNERDLKMLIELYNEKNITKTAEKLFVSQPTLSYRLQQLEKRFNTNIIIRENKGVTFTPEGQSIVEFSRNVIKELSRLEEHLANMQNGIKGTLRIGVASAYARYKLPETLKAFSNLYPEVEIKLTTGWSHQIHKLLKNRLIHVAILRNNYDWSGQKCLVDTENVYVASLNQININELPRFPRIIYKTDQAFQNLMDNWWSEHYSIPSNNTLEVDRLDTCEKMILNGFGYAIIPEICVNNGKIYTEKLYHDNGEPLTIQTWMFYEQMMEELKVVKAFIDFFKTTVED
ncbi:LysR family transcriptional regulator [Peribacillus butanolivorans]|uniref:LysR family transcriptional regulator n=1 Tax=Peribacillus butanolivorans TaxID=421767 RepID=UPI0036575A26